MSILFPDPNDPLEGLTARELEAFRAALKDRPAYKSHAAWNAALWYEHEITLRVNKLMEVGLWPAPIGWSTDIFCDESVRPDFIESRRPKLRLICSYGERK